jgi:hypothetical protein
MPKVIIRDPSVINYSVNSFYHRVKAVEYAWHVFKYNAAGSSDTYRSTVGFKDENLASLRNDNASILQRDRSLCSP